MADSYQTMLDWRELTASYRQAPTLQGMPFTENFFGGASSTTADEVTLYIVGRVNQPAPGNTRGSNPRMMKSPGASKKQFALFHSFNEFPLDANVLRFLRSTDPSIQSIGQELVDAQLEEAGRQQKLFREVCLQQGLTIGRVNLDGAGNILVPTVNASTGAITDAAGTLISADFQVPDTRRATCDSIFAGNWDTASTDMFQQLANARDKAIKDGSEVPTTVWMHKKRAPALIQNNTFKVYSQYNNVRNEDVLQGKGVDNIWGWNFRFLEGYWTDVNGTQHEVIPTTNAILTPDGGDWMRKKEGTQDVPTTLEIQTDIEAALRTLKPVVGMFSFAQIEVSPLVKLKLFTGDNFGWGFPNPNAIWMPKVFAA